jgi:hypothetical protein
LKTIKMLLMNKIRSSLLFGILACLGCSLKEGKRESTLDSLVKVDQAIYLAANIDTLDQLVKYFEGDQKREIPLPLCASLSKVDKFAQMFSKCYSYEMIKYVDLKLFIVTLNCTAGGICEQKRLFVFDKNKLKSELGIGLTISDHTFSRKVDYKFIRNDFLELKKIEQKFDDDGKILSDSTSFEYYSIGTDGVITMTVKP